MDLTKYVKVRNEKFGAVLFDTLNEKVYVTNESGKDILSLMVDGSDVPTIVRCLGERHAEGASAIERDVTEFLDNLEAAGLLAPAAKEEL